MTLSTYYTLLVLCGIACVVLAFTVAFPLNAVALPVWVGIVAGFIWYRLNRMA